MQLPMRNEAMLFTKVREALNKKFIFVLVRDKGNHTSEHVFALHVYFSQRLIRNYAVSSDCIQWCLCVCVCFSLLDGHIFCSGFDECE